ncbi:hypothetical protein GCM10023092_24370 [Rurimicrobium arvi]|uniref:Uncharacterized protein n=1 Tax=Rurimicrobium arvi TaxID=2049916 RepID=A0ABP8MZT1_9BACT
MKGYARLAMTRNGKPTPIPSDGGEANVCERRAGEIAPTRKGDCAQCKNLLTTIPNPNVSR